MLLHKNTFTKNPLIYKTILNWKTTFAHKNYIVLRLKTNILTKSHHVRVSNIQIMETTAGWVPHQDASLFDYVGKYNINIYFYTHHTHTYLALVLRVCVFMVGGGRILLCVWMCVWYVCVVMCVHAFSLIISYLSQVVQRY